MNFVSVTTILVLHVGVIAHPVTCPYDFMFPRRSYYGRFRAREEELCSLGGVSRGAFSEGSKAFGGCTTRKFKAKISIYSVWKESQIYQTVLKSRSHLKKYP